MADYTAVLLAAGYGSRIAEITDRPKSLLPIAGKSILEHHLDTWKELGIKDVVIVLGYKADLIKEVADTYKDDFNLTYELNDDYRNMGNTHSLYLGIKERSNPVIIFDADLVYDQSILEGLLKDNQGNQILVGPGSLEDEESSKVLLDKTENVRRFVDKRFATEDELKEFHFAGEALGILKFSGDVLSNLQKATVEFLSEDENKNLNWEFLLNKFMPKHDVNSHFNPSEKWIEIDTPEDYEQAKQIFEGC